MSDPIEPHIKFRAVRLSGWRAAVAIVVGLTVLLALTAFLALGFLFVVVPAMIVGAIAYYLLPTQARRTVEDLKAPNRRRNTTVIDGTYKVADEPAEDGIGPSHDQQRD